MLGVRQRSGWVTSDLRGGRLRGGPIRLGALAGAATAVIEGTLGWAIAWWIGPGRVQGDEAAPAALAATVIVVVGIGAAPHTPVYGK
jgi:hypothetical protein